MTLNSAYLAWCPVTVTNATTGLLEADKTLTVPFNKDWDLKALNVLFTASSAVGVRRLGIEIRADDSTGTTGPLYHKLKTQGTLTANQEGTFLFSNANSDFSTWTNSPASTSGGALTLQQIPADVILGPGFRIRVFDDNAVGTTVTGGVDDITINALILERPTVCTT